MRIIGPRSIIPILFLIYFSVCKAQSFNTLIVYSHDDHAYEVNIETGATMSFSDSTLSIESHGEILLLLSLDNVRNWDAVPAKGGLSEVESQKDFSVSYSGTSLQVISHVGAVRIALNNANGMAIYDNYDNYASIPFKQLPSGLYIITVDHQLIKLCKR